MDTHIGWLKSAADLPPGFSAKGRVIVAHSGNLKDLKFDLEQAGVLPVKPYQSWSDVSFALAGIFKAYGRYSNEQIAAALMADLECNHHITGMADQAKKRRAIERLISRSHIGTANAEGAHGERARLAGAAARWLSGAEHAQRPARDRRARHRVQLRHLPQQVTVRLQGRHARHTVEHIVGEVTDNGIIALRQRMSDTFGFDLTDKHTRDAVTSLALEHCFDPVVDMLAEAEAGWDRRQSAGPHGGGVFQLRGYHAQRGLHPQNHDCGGCQSA